MSIEIVMVKISELIPAPYNPRQLSKHDAIQLKKSLDEFGFIDPVIVNSHPSRKNIIIGGHQRINIAKANGYTEVPVVYVPIEDIKREQELNLRLNRNTGEWDWDKIANEFDVDFLKDVGFTDKELQAIPADDIEEDTIPEAPKKARAKKGEIYLLGRHRLMCGDSTKIEDVKNLMNGKKADMVFTDPPYGISVVGSNGSIGKGVLAKEGTYRPVIGDDKEYNPEHLLNLADVIFIWGANFFSNKLPLGQWVVWDKERPEGTTFGECELAWTNGKGKAISIYRNTWNGMIREGETGKRVHPTQKPIKLCSNLLKDYSKDNEIILDLFGGSGSTLIACEQTNRICHGMEIDPIYCDVIIERYCNLVGADKEEIYEKAKR